MLQVYIDIICSMNVVTTIFNNKFLLFKSHSLIYTFHSVSFSLCDGRRGPEIEEKRF